MIRLTEQQVLSVHEMMINATGGLNGTRDMGLLQSALNAPFQAFGGKEVYPSLLSKAAAMCRSVISNHPFVRRLCPLTNAHYRHNFSFAVGATAISRG